MGRGLEDSSPGDSGKTVYVLDQMVVKDLASAIGVKPFKIVADLLALERFKNADEAIDFETASIIARKHGVRVNNEALFLSGRSPVTRCCAIASVCCPIGSWT